MKGVIIAILALSFFASCKTSDVSTELSESENETTNVVFADLDFEDSGMGLWQAQYNSTNFAVVTDSDITHNKCGMFLLNENGDYWTSPANGSKTARSEIQLMQSGVCNTLMYYRWDFKIPTEYVESGDWQIIGQFHDQPDESIGETWGNYAKNSPPLAIKYKNGNVIVAVYSWDSSSVMDIAVKKIAKDKWNTIVLRTYWSVGENGSIEAWLNGEKIQASNGQTIYYGRNCFNKACNYLKIGLYRSNEIMTKGIVYYDNVESSYSSLLGN